MEFFFNQLRHVGGGMSGGRRHYRWANYGPNVTGGVNKPTGKGLYDTIQGIQRKSHRIIHRKIDKALGKIGVPKTVGKVQVRTPVRVLIVGLGAEAGQMALEYGADKAGRWLGPQVEEQGKNLYKNLSTRGASDWNGLPWYLKRKRINRLKKQAFTAYRMYRRYS